MTRIFCYGIVWYHTVMSNNKQKRKNKNKTFDGASWIVFTDGGCEKPGEHGAYAYVVLNRTTKRTGSYSKAFRKTTNCRMEVMAAVQALKSIDTKEPIVLYSDSEYLVKTMKGLFARKKNGDLWREMDTATEGKDVLFIWIKGHAGYKYNEICDQLCTKAMADGPYEIDTGYEQAISKYNSLSQKYVEIGLDSSEIMRIPVNTPDSMNQKPDISSVWRYSKFYCVHKECAAMLCNFYKYDFHAFKHYAELKTFGKDYWSDIKLRELRKILGEEEVELIESFDFSEDEIANVIRWRLRGMMLNDAIRKVIVDKNVTQKFNNMREEV